MLSLLRIRRRSVSEAGDNRNSHRRLPAEAIPLEVEGGRLTLDASRTVVARGSIERRGSLIHFRFAENASGYLVQGGNPRNFEQPPETACWTFAAGERWRIQVSVPEAQLGPGCALYVLLYGDDGRRLSSLRVPLNGDVSDKSFQLPDTSGRACLALRLAGEGRIGSVGVALSRIEKHQALQSASRGARSFETGFDSEVFAAQDLLPADAIELKEVRLTSAQVSPGRTYRFSLAVEEGGAPSPMLLRLRYTPAKDEDVRSMELRLSRSMAGGALNATFRAPSFVGSMRVQVVAMKKGQMSSRFGAYGLLVPVSAPINPAWIRDADENSDTHQPLRLPSAPNLKPRPGLAPGVKIAFIGSDDLARSLAWEADVVTFPVRSWRERLSSNHPDLILIETAWKAGQPSWSDALKGGAGASELIELTAWARRNRIPVSLWAREDAINIQYFAWLADHCDRVYGVDDQITTALRGRRRKPFKTLRAGVQLRDFNPIRSPELAAEPDERRAVPVLDGFWDLSADLALTSRSDLAAAVHVVENRWCYGPGRLSDVSSFRYSCLGSLGVAARRVLFTHAFFQLRLEGSFEAGWRRFERSLQHGACGSLSLIAGAPAQLDELHERLVDRIASADDLLSAASAWMARPEALHRRQAERFKEVAIDHDIADRLAEILTDAGVTFTRPSGPRICVVLPTKRPQLVERCISWFRRQSYRNSEMVIVLHNDSVSAADFAHLLGDGVRMVQLSSTRSLGECMNFAAMQTEADYIAKIDDDDFYGDNYLSDFALYARFTDIALSGKVASFFHLEDHDGLYFLQDRARRAWTCFPATTTSNPVAGGTIIAKRSLYRELGFPEDRRGGSDTMFIRRCLGAGHDLITLDSMNYALFRSAQEGFHTWNLDSDHLVRRGRRLENLAVDETVAV